MQITAEANFSGETMQPLPCMGCRRQVLQFLMGLHLWMSFIQSEMCILALAAQVSVKVEPVEFCAPQF